MAVPRRTVRGVGGQEGEGGQGLQQPGSGRDRDAAVLGIGVHRAVFVEENHMLANPDGADAALLGFLADESQQLRRGERISGRYPEIDAHERSLVVGRVCRAAVVVSCLCRSDV